MKDAKLFSLLLIGSMAGATVQSLAQQQPPIAAPAAAATAAQAASSAAPAPSTSTPAAAATTGTPKSTAAAKPSGARSKTNVTANGLPADVLKKARQNGYYTRVRSGQTFFCKKEAHLGTRFVTERCFDEEQLAMVLERNDAQRDQLKNVVCSGGGGCGGGK